MSQSIQHQLFQKILQKYSRKANAVESLSDFLSVGKDAIYRRFRGDTLLTPEEMKLLAHRYQVSLDALIFDQTDTVFVSYNAFKQQTRDFYEFMMGIYQTIDQVNSIPGSEFYYATVEVPIFLSMYSPELLAFKLYVWGVTTWDFEYLRENPFSLDIISPKVIALGKKTIEIYHQLPTTELWDLRIADNTLNQIEYMAVVDKFQKPTDALLLCDKLLELFQHIRKVAELGRKMAPGQLPEFAGASFHLFHNELASTNNTFLIKTALGKSIITTFCNPNYFQSSDPKLCDYTEEWLNKIIAKSNSISTHSAKNRNWYFNRLEKRILMTRNRLEMILEY